MAQYTVRELATMMHVSEETVRKWIREDKLKAEMTSKRTGLRIDGDELRSFVTRHPKYKFLLNDQMGPAVTTGLGAVGVGLAAGGSAAAIPFLGASLIAAVKSARSNRSNVEVSYTEETSQITSSVEEEAQISGDQAAYLVDTFIRFLTQEAIESEEKIEGYQKEKVATEEALKHLKKVTEKIRAEIALYELQSIADKLRGEQTESYTEELLLSKRSAQAEMDRKLSEIQKKQLELCGIEAILQMLEEQHMLYRKRINELRGYKTETELEGSDQNSTR